MRVKNFRMFALEFVKENRVLSVLIPIKALLESSISLGIVVFSSTFLKKLLLSNTLDVLIFYVVKVLLVLLVLQVILQYVCHHITIKKACLLENQNYVLNKVSLKMDYANLENSEVQDMRIKQEEYTNITGGIYKKFSEIFESGISSIFTIIGSLAIIIIKSDGDSWFETNGYIFFVFILGIYVAWINSITLKRFSVATEKYFESCLKGNRLLIYYLFNVLFENNTAKDLRIFLQQELILKGIDEANGLFLQASKEYVKEARIKRIISQTVSTLPVGLMYIWGGLRVYNGIIQTADVVRIVGGISSLFISFSELANVCSEAILISDRIKEYMEYIQNNSFYKGRDRKKLEKKQYNLSFEDVSFCYPGSDTYILRNLNLSINDGEKVAIVGKNGSGKTTLIKLICRLYNVTSGVIKLNGININDYEEEEYRAILSSVFQDFTIFSFSLYENIASGQMYDDMQIRRAIIKSGLEERVKKSRGDMIIGREFDDNGIDLSRGERQKIAIARAIYKRGEIVIMDEPTAALDPMAEHDLYSKFNNVIEYSVAIYVSHRLASCKFCDRIIVLNNGQVEQDGTHIDLLKRNGLYKEMWESQASNYIK